jgi:hypothetical protein
MWLTTVVVDASTILFVRWPLASQVKLIVVPLGSVTLARRLAASLGTTRISV